MAAAKDDAVVLDVGGHDVRVSHPGKIVFPEPGLTKLDLVRYYLAVADGALRGAGGRPMVLKRFVKGIAKEPFFQKRVPENHPDFIDTATLHYASGTSAEEAVIRDAAGLAWVVNLGCLDLNPHPVRAEDLDHPDELRVDLDPMPGVDWSQIVDVAMVARDVLDDHGLVGWPKTSGSRGMHLLVRIQPEWEYPEVRLDIDFLDSEQAYDKVLRGELELGIITLAPEEKPPLQQQRVWRDELVVVVAKSHPLATQQRVTARALSQHRAILPGLNTYTGQIVTKLFEQQQLSLDVALETNYLESIRSMVAIGLGWSILPRLMVDDALCGLALSGLSLNRNLGVVSHRDRTLSNAGAALLQLLQAEANQQPE